MSNTERKQITTAVLVVARKYGFNALKVCEQVKAGHGVAYNLFLKQIATSAA